MATSEPILWDAHAGFSYGPDVSLADLELWRSSGVNFLSVNVAYDVPPFSSKAWEALSNYREQVATPRDNLLLCTTVTDVLDAKRDGKLGLAFDFEGSDALAGKLENVERAYRLGVRQMLLAYNRNNLAAGGCHDDDQGLTGFGRELIHEMNRLGMVVDCSHGGFKSTIETMELSKAPVIFSHSNARALRDHERNIVDEQMRACAATGGVVGLTGVDLFLNPPGAKLPDLIDHIDYVSELIGPEHVGIGLDIVLKQGSVGVNKPENRSYWPQHQYSEEPHFFHPSIWSEIEGALRSRGFAEPEVMGILGANFMRVAEKVWK